MSEYSIVPAAAHAAAEAVDAQAAQVRTDAGLMTVPSAADGFQTTATLVLMAQAWRQHLGHEAETLERLATKVHGSTAFMERTEADATALASSLSRHVSES